MGEGHSRDFCDCEIFANLRLKIYFGDTFHDFSLPDNPAAGVELVKEGFTLEFMKNALVRPVLFMKSRKTLMRWWRKVEKGEEAPLPKPSDVFKSESYVNFIFLYFKIATEINVFSHLANSLLALVKDSILNGNKYEDNVELSDSDGDDESSGEDDVNAETDFVITSEQTEENSISSSESKAIVMNIIDEVLHDACKKVDTKPTNTVTSLYGKVYVLKPSIKAL